MAKSRSSFVCSECGASFPVWSGRCPNCDEWATLEERLPERPAAGAAAPTAAQAHAVSLVDVATEGVERVRTGIGELDRVLGGGLPGGCTVLLGGEPGVGKSTLMLQALGRMATEGVQCAYLACEEPLAQLKERARRLGLGDAPLTVATDHGLAAALGLVGGSGARVVVVDSIQRLAAEDLDSARGSLRQVSACATALSDAAQGSGCSVVLVGHVTKRGLIAGPRALEHLVDTVLYFESEQFQSLRILRAAKNRFGAIEEIGVFEMGAQGLAEVGNPSALFLAERESGAAGSAVTAVMEGSRALLVEVQALVGPGAYGTPERKVSGVDYGRFSMMTSVLERHAGVELGRCDAFVNVAGGLRVAEPAVDLPMTLALASSFHDRAVPADAVVMGEVGLGGEVRSVSRVAERLREAQKLGFTRAVVPAGNAGATGGSGLRVHAVRNLSQAIDLLERPAAAAGPTPG